MAVVIWPSVYLKLPSLLARLSVLSEPAGESGLGRSCTPHGALHASGCRSAENFFLATWDALATGAS